MTGSHDKTGFLNELTRMNIHLDARLTLARRLELVLEILLLGT